MPAANLTSYTLASILDRAARLYGERTAIIDGDCNWNWSEYVHRIACAASVLHSMGIRPGQRFAIISHNSCQVAELINAGYWMGAVPVPINYRLAPAEMAYILTDADIRLLVIEDRFSALLDDACFSDWSKNILLLSRRKVESSLPQYLDRMEAENPAAIHVSDPDDDALLLYTGGTTGRSKGVRLSHANILANAVQIGLAISARETDRFLHILPMFHSADLFGTIFTLTGGVHVYVSEFSAENLLQAVHDHGITVLSLAPTTIIIALQYAGFDSYNTGSIRLITYGSAPMAVEWIRKAMQKFPNSCLQQSYGLTETSPILTTLTYEEHQRVLATGNYDLLRSVGKPLVNIDLQIVDDDDRPLATGEVGEVVVRGPNVTKGYLGLDEQNRETFRNGWFHTGDIGTLDASGNLFLKDRKKDMIITGSENVYSSEVEAALYKHPHVHEAAVIGVPDEKWGEAVFAVIVTAPGETLTEEDVITHCRQHIGGFKIPRRMAFVDELPKSAMGKILKTELRQRYSST